MISCRYRQDIDAVLFEISGEFTLAEYLDAMNEFQQSAHFRPGIHSIWDFRKLTVASMPDEDLRAIAEYQKKIASTRGPSWKAALVVASDLSYGLSRMFEAYSDTAPNQVTVFRSMEEAVNWIKPE